MSVKSTSTRLSHVCVASLALLVCAAAPALAQEPNLWDKMLSTVGVGGKPEARPETRPAPAPVAAPAQAPAVPAPAQASSQSPGFFDNVLGKVGLGAAEDPNAIDYSERRKLAVPQQRTLPPPAPTPERKVARPGDEESLTKPPADYVQKAVGADGQATGLRDGDLGKEKKFFGLF